MISMGWIRENIDRECNNSVIKIIGMYALKALECSLSYK